MAENATYIEEDDDEPKKATAANNMVLYNTILGFIIGLLFPVGATLLYLRGQELSISNIIAAQTGGSEMLWIIDLAPFVIGAIFNYFARRNRKQNEDLERMLAEKNEIFTNVRYLVSHSRLYSDKFIWAI